MSRETPRYEPQERLEAIDREIKSIDGAFSERSMTSKARDKGNALVEEREEKQALLDEANTRAEYIASLPSETERITDYDDPGNRTRGGRPLVKNLYNRALMGDKSVERSQGLKAIEELQRDGLSAQAADRLDGLFRSEGSSKDALYLRATSTPAYSRAWMKRMSDPEHGHHSYTSARADAMRNAMECSRSIGLGTQGGQAPVPAALDPSINLVSDGRVNPIRALARTVTINSDRWLGVKSLGATAHWYAEFGTVSDDSPVLTQPTITPQRYSVFCPISLELFDDWSNATAEITRIFSDAKNQLEADAFTLGDGTGEPYGLIRGGATVVSAGTADSNIPQNVYNLQQGLPPRYHGGAAFLSSNTWWNRAVRSVAEADTSEPNFISEDRQSALGYPWYQTSAMSTAVAGTVAAFGDIGRAYCIIDRVGGAVELVPHLLDPVSGRPYGARGLFYWGRVGGSVVDDNALRTLDTS